MINCLLVKSERWQKALDLMRGRATWLMPKGRSAWTPTPQRKGALKEALGLTVVCPKRSAPDSSEGQAIYQLIAQFYGDARATCVFEVLRLDRGSVEFLVKGVGKSKMSGFRCQYSALEEALIDAHLHSGLVCPSGERAEMRENMLFAAGRMIAMDETVDGGSAQVFFTGHYE